MESSVGLFQVLQNILKHRLHVCVKGVQERRTPEVLGQQEVQAQGQAVLHGRGGGWLPTL